MAGTAEVSGARCRVSGNTRNVFEPYRNLTPKTRNRAFHWRLTPDT
jgi:hypothetical protein